MAQVLNPAWVTKMHAKIDGGQPVDETMGHSLPKQFLVKALAAAGRPYTIFQLGCGVVRITTETGVCPCCGGKVDNSGKAAAT